MSQIFPKATVALIDMQLRQMREQQGKMKKQFEEQGMEMPGGMQQVPEDPYHNQEALKRMAGQFGPGVTFVKSQKYDKSGAKGAVAMYKFEDINQIFINPEALMENSVQFQMQMRSSGDDDEEMVVAEATPESVKFGINDKQEGQRELTIKIPEYPEVDIPDPEAVDEIPELAERIPKSELDKLMANGNPLGLTGDETQADMMTRMMSGMEMALAVEAAEGIAETDAQYKSPDHENRVIVYDLQMAQALAEKPKMTMHVLHNLQGMGGSMLKLFSAMSQLPGSKVAKQKEINITFK